MTVSNGAIYNNTLSAASSLDNLKNKVLTKNLSQVSAKVQTYNTKKTISQLPPQND